MEVNFLYVMQTLVTFFIPITELACSYGKIPTWLQFHQVLCNQAILPSWKVIYLPQGPQGQCLTLISNTLSNSSFATAQR